MSKSDARRFPIKIALKDYRAIKEADILLDGITIVAGENGCGKSTLSRILYYFFKTSISYNQLVAQQFWLEMEDVLSLLLAYTYGNSTNNIQGGFSRSLTAIRRAKVNNELSESICNMIIDLLERIRELEEQGQNPSSSDRVSLRFLLIAKDILKSPLDKSQRRKELISRIIDFVNEKFNQSQQMIDSRSGELFHKELEKHFHTETLPERLDITEIDQVLFSLKNDKVIVPYGTANALYIDTPMLLGEENSDTNPHWNEINDLLQSKEYHKDNEEVTSIIRNILDGDVEFDDDFSAPYVFKYKRNGDGRVFDLFDCATGIKSFSIVQMLLKLGHISSKTLLVFDEPEAHLHPQWVVEYARMIVLIHKHIGTKFFIATHNPDFVSAIRHIAEKEKMLDAVNFYLAQCEEGKYQYTYHPLGNDIEPIFKSFNLALDRIEEYGV